jgi:hypothetical protein
LGVAHNGNIWPLWAGVVAFSLDLGVWLGYNGLLIRLSLGGLFWGLDDWFLGLSLLFFVKSLNLSLSALLLIRDFFIFLLFLNETESLTLISLSKHH